MKTEQMAIPVLRDAIEYCEKVRDYGSRDLFYKILHNEEEHVDYIETQFDLINADRHPELHPAAVEAEREPGAVIAARRKSALDRRTSSPHARRHEQLLHPPSTSPSPIP